MPTTTDDIWPVLVPNQRSRPRRPRRNAVVLVEIKITNDEETKYNE